MHSGRKLCSLAVKVAGLLLMLCLIFSAVVSYADEEENPTPVESQTAQQTQENNRATNDNNSTNSTPQPSPKPSASTKSESKAEEKAPSTAPTPEKKSIAPLNAQNNNGGPWTLTFNVPDAESQPPASQTVPDGEKATRPTPDPVREGYFFDGWFDGQIPFDFSKPLTKNTTLTGRWSKDNGWYMTPTRGPSTGQQRVTITPPYLRDVRFTQMSAEYNHTLAVASDGKAYAWGYNDYGKLGDGTTEIRNAPVQVKNPQGVNKDFTFLQVSAGELHSLAVGSDGNAYAWGANGSGRLGDGTEIARNTPIQVKKPDGVGSDFKFVQVSAGVNYSLAIGSNGKAYAWGFNDFGKLGDGTVLVQFKPIQVVMPDGVGSDFKFVQVSAGYTHSLALGSDGNVYGWGANGYGKLGDGTVLERRRPTMVLRPTGVPADFVFTQIFASYEHSLALGSDGKVYGWGGNAFGKLGDGTTMEHFKPEPALMPEGAPANFAYTQITAGYQFTMALGTDGNIYGWGYNGWWNLGSILPDYYTTKPAKAKKPEGVSQDFTYRIVSAGREFAFGFGSNGYTYGWGSGAVGRLGLGTIPPVNLEVGQRTKILPEATLTRVTFGGVPGTDLAPGEKGTWLVTTPSHAPGTVDVAITWNIFGQNQPDIHLPYLFEGPPHAVTLNPANGQPSTQEQVIDGRLAKRPSVDPVREGYQFDGWFLGDIPYDFSKPVTSDITITAHWTEGDGTWGLEPDSGPAIGKQAVTLIPPKLRGIHFAQVNTGKSHTLAVGSDGNVYAWGSNAEGQLGTGTAGKEEIPTKVQKPDGVPSNLTFVQVSAGGSHSLALGSDGNVYAWGSNAEGQLGDGSNSQKTKPVKVATPVNVPPDFAFLHVSAGGSHSLALGSDGNVYAWGSNNKGQLGIDAAIASRNKPARVSKPIDGLAFNFEQVSAGDSHSLALGSDGNIYVWGNNANGQLGNNNTVQQSKPVKAEKPLFVIPDFKYVEVSAGGNHSMATGSDNSTYAWGSNTEGQLGDSTNIQQIRPTRVTKPFNTPFDFKFIQLSAGDKYSLALGSDYALYAWGNNANGQLGDGTSARQNKPIKVSKPANTPTGFKFASASAGSSQSLATDSNGKVYAWGNNANGQLGDGSSVQRLVPVSIAFPLPGIPTGAVFGDAAGTNLTPNSDGTWQILTPAHKAETVTVTISWTRGGKVQADDVSNHYTFIPMQELPQAGGPGILLAFILGPLVVIASLYTGYRLKKAKS